MSNAEFDGENYECSPTENLDELNTLFHDLGLDQNDRVLCLALEDKLAKEFGIDKNDYHKYRDYKDAIHVLFAAESIVDEEHANHLFFEALCASSLEKGLDKNSSFFIGTIEMKDERGNLMPKGYVIGHTAYAGENREGIAIYQHKAMAFRIPFAHERVHSLPGLVRMNPYDIPTNEEFAHIAYTFYFVNGILYDHPLQEALHSHLQTIIERRGYRRY